MISIEDWTAIRALHARGVSIKAIARQLGISRNTVRRALRGDDPPKYVRKKPSARATDPFLEHIRQMYVEKQLIGTRIYAELQKMGYQGSLSAVHRCLQRLKKEQPHTEVRVQRMETAPGEQAQFDWSEYSVKIGGKEVKVYAYRYILSYSRMRYTHFALNQTLETVLEALECGIRHFGGVPERVLIDNAGQMVVDHRPDGAVRYHPEFLKVMGLYRMDPYACAPYRAQTKGKVERAFYMLEQHFLKGTEFKDFEDLITQGKSFDESENQRVHRRLGQTPLERFEADRAALRPLPERRYVDSVRVLRRVSRDGYISVDHVEYSVPPSYLGREVWVTQPRGAYVEMYGPDGTFLCRHVKSRDTGSIHTLPEHQAPHRERVSVRQRFCEVFPSGAAFYQGLTRRYAHNARYHAARILDMRSTYSDESIEMALKEALAYGATDEKVVLKLLANYPTKPAASSRNVEVQALSRRADTIRPLSYYSQLLH
ncbi:IS21 family transposase [Kyrpidia spormannii]|uniref:IS21 family transposase n=1 Tax=Kyrpidia spormannii TaxID=2055160 RepID=UPI0012FFEF2F|nr:IS21 family transposase [Kyrpidia spormannii]